MRRYSGSLFGSSGSSCCVLGSLTGAVVPGGVGGGNVRCGGGAGDAPGFCLLPSHSFRLTHGGHATATTAALTTQARFRFYRPLVNQGINLWRYRMGRIHKGWNMWEYQHTKADPRPFPEPSVNNYFGKTRLWNPVAGKIGLINKKAEEWNWPHEKPPPTGLRQSKEFFPFFFDRYFPDVEVKLMLDSVLNNETTHPVFQIPQDMSRQELVNYLRNLYNIDNIVRISVRNVRGKRFKNEVGMIKSMPDYKLAVVELDSPVVVEFKQIKGTEDTPDNKPQTQIS